MANSSFTCHNQLVKIFSQGCGTGQPGWQHPALDGFLFWSIARRDLPGCESVLRPSSEFVRELLRPADEEDHWHNPFVIVTRPAAPPTVANHPTNFNPLHGLLEHIPANINGQANDVAGLNPLR
jgi:hypothetical protein